MRIKHVTILAIAATTLVSCSSTKFSEYRGELSSKVLVGKGGTVRMVNGIAFWENGEPDRKYKVLGMIDNERLEIVTSGSGSEKDIAKVAKINGGDAVILGGESRELKALGDDVWFSRGKRAVVVKYVD